MAARALWKGVVRFGEVRVPVKLYAAVEDRRLHFRLLHAADRAPVRQMLISPDTSAVVPYERARRAMRNDAGDVIALRDQELSDLEPPASRDIQVLSFLPPDAIDHRWYLRPYYLGPDEGGADAYAALAKALERLGREGLTRWVMRKKAYVGALRLHRGHPVLIALRHAEQVAALEDLPAPGGPALDERELAMARQLVEMLAADFEPEHYRDQYRERVYELIEAKQRGGRIPQAPRPETRPVQDIAEALEASLKRARAHA